MRTISQNSISNQAIFRVAIALPIYHLFDYSVPEHIHNNKISPGIRLIVPFGNTKKIAYLVEIIYKPTADTGKLKAIEQILDKEPLLQKQDLHLLSWASNYYHHPLGEVISAAFPVRLRKGHAAKIKNSKSYQLTELGHKTAISELKRAPRQMQLLQHFKNSNSSLNAQHLSAVQKNYSACLKNLINKELVEIVEQPNLTPNTTQLQQTPLKANSEQKFAIESVSLALHRFNVFLLEGITGSGKTEVYMQIIHNVLKQGQQIMVLLPEISLTPQLQQRFQNRFLTSIAIFHSSLSETIKQNAWLNFQQGYAQILLGTRSALFTPCKNLGLIILDEEHDSSFKQQEGFRFSARDMAIVRAKKLNIPVVMGSATPSLESLHNVNRKRYQLLQLSERAGNAIHPTFTLLDIRNQSLQDGLSMQLIKEIRHTIAKQEQVLIFINRRGFAPTLICNSCAWVARCHQCDANLVVHQNLNLLRCHHCAAEQKLAAQCPKCHSPDLTALGLGTERVEQVLKSIFCNETVLRLDRDTTQKKGHLEHMLEEINQGSVAIILGTQMLAKGHHFPNVTLVALLDVDSGLFSIDFHATEKLAQLIIQVAGRAGRAEKPGKVILQTRQPDHPLLQMMINNDYAKFAQITLQERQHAMLPPYSFQALLRAWSKIEQLPLDFLNHLQAEINQQFQQNKVSMLGPVSSPMMRRAGNFRYQLLFQSQKRQDLQTFLSWLVDKISNCKQARKIRWSLDVDPIDLY